MQKNKLNLHIYGIHLLNPYKTVVSHLKDIFGSEARKEKGIIDNESTHEFLASVKSLSLK